MEKNIQLRYSADKLAEFKKIILEKIEVTQTELEHFKNLLSGKSDNSASPTLKRAVRAEDVSESIAREELTNSAARLAKFLTQLTNALVRIQNGTYGICVKTGKLIPEERLRVVPHTTMCIEAKLAKAA